MKNQTITLIALALMLAFGANAQTALTSTTITNAITVNQQTFAVASTTGMTATNPQTKLYVIDKGGQARGEIMLVTAVNSSTSVTVARGAAFRAAHVAGSIAIIANAAQALQSYDPVGSCTSTNTLYDPWINTNNGYMWQCSTVTGAWVPSWNNPLPKSPSTLLHSSAGAQTISGPLFHMDGTNAITSWTLPAGFPLSGGFCVIPDAAYTTVAGNNVGSTTTAVATQIQCWTYSSADGKFYASYK